MHPTLKTRRHRAWFIIFSIVIFQWQMPVYSAQTTENMGVTADVANSCVVGQSRDVNFGYYEGTTILAEGAISINCAKGMAVRSIGLGDGQNILKKQRRMKAKTQDSYVAYNIYRPIGVDLKNTPPNSGSCSNANDVWSDSPGQRLKFPGHTGEFPVTRTVLINVCGELTNAAAASAPADEYLDIVTINVDFK